MNMKRLFIELGKERHTVSTPESDFHPGFTLINITILRLTNPDVYPKRMHQLYIAVW